MKTKIAKIMIFAVILVVALFGTVNILKNKVFAAEGTSTTRASTSTADTGERVEGEPDPDSYNYESSCGSFWEAREKNSMPLPLPAYGGYQIYCSEHGVDAEVLDSYPYTYKEIEASNGKTQTGEPCVTLEPPVGTISPIGYQAINTAELPPVAAYIISDSPQGEWTADKQRGLWNLSEYTGGLIKILGHSANDGPSKYDTEGIYYYYYDQEVRGKGLQPENQTITSEQLGDNPTAEELEKVLRVNINTETGEYIVGPFKMKYTNGRYDDIAFSGISNMEVLGYNAKGELVRGSKGDQDSGEEAIKIEKIILADKVTGALGSSQEPDYFTPDQDKVDRTEQVYPESEQEFYIVYSDPNEGLAADDENRVAKICLKVQFQYMLAYGEYTEYNGTKLTVQQTHEHPSLEICYKRIYLQSAHQQNQICVDAIRVLYEQELIICSGDDEGNPIDTTMELGGHVWEDGVATKESKADGVSNTDGEGIDTPLPNVKVTLYETTDGSDGVLATLMTDPNEAGIDEAEVMHRINSTLTDENGDYLFRGLNPMKKYYVTFEYNGQTYLPTEYLNTGSAQYNSVQDMVNAGLYNTTEWEVTSKGTEAETAGSVEGVDIGRTEFDQRYQEIASYPENYTSSNSLGQGLSKNAVFTKLDLMGYELSDSGTYSQTGTQLIDGFKYDEKGLETDEYSEGVISQKIKEFINSNKKYPSEDEMKSIYSEIAGGDQETWMKLQFIEDCYINAYSGSPLNGGQVDLYPVYDQFKINNAINGTYDMSSDIIDGVEYKPIYPGQYYVNLGLWRRQEFDMALRKDVYKAALKINNKTVVYDYNQRNIDKPEDGENGTNNESGQDNESYWDINVRMSDYNAYYGASYNDSGSEGYNRELYQEDYDYDSAALGHPGSDLEVYITYKITLRNQSMSIEGKIKEVVDYYDNEFTFKPNLSWIMFQTEDSLGEPDENEYYAMMEQEQSVIDGESTAATSFISGSSDANASDSSRYGNEGTLDEHKSVYVKGLENEQLQTGEMAFIYLTFEANKDGNGKIILDDESSPKDNIAEINGYETYYRDGTELPNGVTKGSGDIAGLLDRDSNPGNADEDLEGKLNEDKFEKYFEDDTDRAPALRIIIDEDGIRRANGTVWEDDRTEDQSGAKIGNGIREDGEIGVAGVTVQLVEKCINGAEYIWQQTTTDENGAYSFESYIPADYVIRFYYGDTEATALSNTISGSGANVTSYNGQDFKSTTYQVGIDQNGATDEQGRYQGYVNTETQNVSGKYNANKNSPTDDTYGYDIYKADSDTTNYSDAKDIWSTDNRSGQSIIGPVQSAREIQGRQAVNDYSTTGVTNHVAEVLASAYERPTYNGTAYTDEELAALHQELMNETYMTSETGVIVVEFEYNRQQTGKDQAKDNGNGVATGDNIYNGEYTLANIDLGLTERPKAQLEIDKSISNINVTLANGTTLFDITGSANNALWQDHKEYNLMDKQEDGMYENYYGKNHRYALRTENNGVNDIVTGTDKGLVQLTMDEELMHGATIRITYLVKVKNVGETDYVDDATKDFYYKGVADGAAVATTSADELLDCVHNNLQFDASNEKNTQSGWSIIDKGIIVPNTTENTPENLINAKLEGQVNGFNNIIHTTSYGAALEPGGVVQGELVLTQLITPENTDDDLTYNNMVEIVKTTNTAGRRMAYSVVGNQDQTQDNASEVDASAAERVVILPPFGQTPIYYVLGAIIGIILIAGIVLIIVKVNKRGKGPDGDPDGTPSGEPNGEPPVDGTPSGDKSSEEAAPVEEASNEDKSSEGETPVEETSNEDKPQEGGEPNGNDTKQNDEAPNEQTQNETPNDGEDSEQNK